MFLIPGDTDEQTYGMKPMNCPGHMLLYGSRLRSYRDLPIRYAEAAPLHRNELAGTLHGLTRVRYVTQDDAHIFCTEEQVAAEVDAAIDYVRYLYGLFGMEPTRRALDSTRQPARLGRPMGPRRGSSAGRARPARNDVRHRRGGGHVLRAEDRSAHDRCSRPLLADGNDPVRHADARAVRAHVHGGRQPRAHADRDPPSALRLVRALHRDPRRALRGRLPVLAGAGAGARRPGRRGASRAGCALFETGSRARASASSSTSATRRSAGASARPSSRRSRSSSSTATASRTPHSPSESTGASSRRCRSTSSSRDSAGSPQSHGRRRC